MTAKIIKKMIFHKVRVKISENEYKVRVIYCSEYKKYGSTGNCVKQRNFHKNYLNLNVSTIKCLKNF